MKREILATKAKKHKLMKLETHDLSYFYDKVLF